MHDVKRRGDQRGTYGTGNFLRVPDVVRESIAYLVLPSSAREVLLDWIGVYDIASSYDTRLDYWKSGMKYTWGMCWVPISERSFYRALKILQQKGWLQPHGDAKASGCSGRWMPCERWRDYEPTRAELEGLRAHQNKRARYAQDDAQIKVDFDQGKAKRRPRSAPDEDAPATSRVKSSDTKETTTPAADVPSRLDALAVLKKIVRRVADNPLNPSPGPDQATTAAGDPLEPSPGAWRTAAAAIAADLIGGRDEKNCSLGYQHYDPMAFHDDLGNPGPNGRYRLRYRLRHPVN